jgi:O-antigen/teichoic acid export membrane protein
VHQTNKNRPASKDNQVRRLGLDLTSVLATNALIGALNFFVLIYFARALGPEILADYALILIGIELSFLVLNFGFNQILIYQGGLVSTTVAAVFWCTILQSVSLVLVSYAAWFAYSLLDHHDAARLLVPATWLLIARLLGLYGAVALTPLEVKLEHTKVSKIRAVAAIVSSAVGVLAATFEQSVLPFVYRELTSACICLIAAAILTGHSFRLTASKDAFEAVWRYSKRMWILNVLERAALRIEYLLVASLLGRDILGSYFALRSLVEGVLGLLVVPVQTVVFGYYCRSNIKNHVSPILNYGAPFVLGVAVLGFAASIVAGPTLLVGILGAEYQVATPAIAGLVFYSVCVLWYENVKVLSLSLDRHILGVSGRLMQLLVLVIGMPLMAAAWGLHGIGNSLALAGFALAVVPTLLFAMSAPFRARH